MYYLDNIKDMEYKWDLVLFWLIIVCLASCKTNNSVENLNTRIDSIQLPVKDNKIVTNKVDRVIDSSKTSLDVSIMPLNSAKIRLLPFGLRLSKKDFQKKRGLIIQYYDSIINRNSQQSFEIPFIKKLNIVHVDSMYDFIACDNGIDKANMFNLVKFNNRLPDKFGYEIYFICGKLSSDFNYNHYMNGECSSSFLSSHGYILFYEPTTQQAHLLPAYYFGGSDGVAKSRFFYVDSEYNIFLWDYEEWEEGDEGNMLRASYRVTFFGDAKFNVTNLNVTKRNNF